MSGYLMFIIEEMGLWNFRCGLDNMEDCFLRKVEVHWERLFGFIFPEQRALDLACSFYSIASVNIDMLELDDQ